MELVLLPSSTGPDVGFQFLTTYLFDGVLAVDAGSLGFWGDLPGQARVRDVVLTHSHADHIASLPVLLENVYGEGPPVVVHASAAVLDCLRRDVFNDRVFPDLISREPAAGPFARFRELAPGKPVRVGGLTVVAAPLVHPTPTSAILVRDAGGAVLVATETGPSDELWAFAAKAEGLKAVLLDVTFPDALKWLADLSGHMTPAQFAAERAKGPAGVPTFAIHLKPKSRDTVRRELKALKLPGVEVMVPGKVYRF